MTTRRRAEYVFIVGLGSVVFAAVFFPGGRVEADDRVSDSQEVSTEFQYELDRRVQYRLPRARVASGVFDKHGRFTQVNWSTGRVLEYPVAVNDPVVKPGSKLWDAKERVYEFRSGRLVPGVLTYPGVFSPDLDGKVISIDKYVPVDDTPRIYNLPGKFVTLPKGQSRKPFKLPPDPIFEPGWDPRDLKVKDGKIVTPPGAKPLSDPPPAPVEPFDFYTVEADLSRLVGTLKKKVVWIGTLEQDGEFIPSPDFEPVAYDKSRQMTVKDKQGKPHEVPIINLMPEPTNAGQLAGLFELRGMSVVYGRLNEEGKFRPEPDTLVMQMHEGDGYLSWYTRLDGKMPPIYNLPGKIVKKRFEPKK